MTRNLGMMAGLLVLAACNEAGSADIATSVTKMPGAAGAVGKTSPTSAPQQLFSATSFNQITAQCRTRPVETVVMNLENVFEGLSNNRRIFRSIKRGTNDVDNIARTNLQPGAWPTNLDFDASSLGNGPIEVKIVLKTGKLDDKPGVHFLRPVTGAIPTGPDPTSTNSSLAVLVPAPASEFCGRSAIVINAANNTETVSFVMNRVPASPNLRASRSINIGLMVPTKRIGQELQMWLPIFLDPNVRNEG